MSPYFQYRYEGDPFILFSAEHMKAVLIIGLLIVLVVIFANVLRQEPFNQAFRYTLALILLLSELSLQTWLLVTGAWDISFSLPLHLSSITLIFALIMLINRSYLLFELTFFAGLGSALQALLTPDLGAYAFPHFRAVQFFVAHGAVVIAVVYMIVIERYRPVLRSIWKTLIILNMYALVMAGVNMLTGGNYLYIARKPPNPSLLDFLGPWPWYILSMEVIAIVTFFLLYFPFALREKYR